MKYCKTCGNELKEGVKFCPVCGSVVSADEKGKAPEEGKDKALPVSDLPWQTPPTFCKTCGAPLKEGARFCPSCGSPVGSPIGGSLNKDLEPSKYIPPIQDVSTEARPYKTPPEEIKPSQTDNLTKNNVKTHKAKLMPLLYGIIPVLIVVVITVLLYKTGRLPFISSTSFSQRHALLKKKISSKKNAAKKAKKVKLSKKISTTKTKAAKKVTHVYPKAPAHLPVSSLLAPYKPAYRINHVRVAFNTLRMDFGSAQAKIVSFLPKRVSGQSGISFVVISHVYSLASNVNTDSTEMFKVEFTAAVPQNMNTSSVKIVSKIGGQNGFGAENVFFANLSSSGVYTVGIPVRIPAYLAAGSYYFNAEVEVPGMFMTSGNAYFRVE